MERLEKPLLKPADVVTMLCSVSRHPGEPESRLFLANRFRTENEERSRHLFLLSGGAGAMFFNELLRNIAENLRSFSTPIGAGMNLFTGT